MPDSGVAVGSSIGHAVGSLFSGGSSSAPAETQQAPVQPTDNSLYQSNSWETPACETDVRNFRKCMDDNQGSLSICGWYLDQLVREYNPGEPDEDEADGRYRKLARRLPGSTEPPLPARIFSYCQIGPRGVKRLAC
jgi:hypothetical protein